MENYCNMHHAAPYGLYESTAALYKAEHTDELRKDGLTHLRIDYKSFGIGFNSCGPRLQDKYKLYDKDIDFFFSIRPKK